MGWSEILLDLARSADLRAVPRFIGVGLALVAVKHFRMSINATIRHGCERNHDPAT